MAVRSSRIADRANRHCRHPAPRGFRKNCKAFHFHRFRLGLQRPLLLRIARSGSSDVSESLHLLRAALHSRLRATHDGSPRPAPDFARNTTRPPKPSPDDIKSASAPPQNPSKYRYPRRESKSPPRSLQRPGSAHSSQQYANSRRRHRSREYSANDSWHPAEIMAGATEQIRLHRKRNQYLHPRTATSQCAYQILGRPRGRHAGGAPGADIPIRLVPTHRTLQARASTGPGANPSSPRALLQSTNMLWRAMRTPSSGICGSRPSRTRKRRISVSCRHTPAHAEFPTRGAGRPLTRVKECPMLASA